MNEGKGKGLLIAIIVIMVVVNIASIGACVFFYRKSVYEKNVEYVNEVTIPDEEAGISSTPTAEPTDAAADTVEKHDPVAAKHVDDLNSEIAKAELPEGAVASVSVMDGDEYLKLKYGDYSFYYRNDYVKYGTEPYGKVIIEDGDKTETFAWDYSLEAENIGNLLPVIFDWRDNKREQMAFAFKKMEDGENERTGMHFVTCSDLIEYTTLSPEMGLEAAVSIGGFVETENETLVCVVNDSRKYYISAGRKLTDEEKDSISISAVNDVTYKILNERVFVTSKVELSGIGWIGEIQARVTYSTFDIFGNHSNVLYCYAEQMITTEDDMLVMTPVTDYTATLQNKVFLTGDDGEKMIFFAKDGITPSWQDPSLLAANEDGLMVYDDEDTYTVLGVDVSKYNTVTDWKKVKSAGYDFAIIRMGYRGYGTTGSLNTDTKFVSNIEGALNAGLDVGVYYFTQAITVEEAIEEANAIVSAIKKYNVKYPVIFDTEFYTGVDEARANYMSVQLRTDIIKAFCETVTEAGYTAMIYSSTNWSLLEYDRSQLDEYDFWYAYYGINLDYPYHYEIWQYASDAEVPGITGDVDVNICFKNYKTK